MTEVEREPGEPLTVYSIGHSNQPMERFLDLLALHGIQILADVRSQPYSRYVPHFNQAGLEDAVERRGIQYLFLGQELGGRPVGEQFYDAEGYVLYGVVAEAPFFRKGIERLKDEAALSRIAVMCSEEDPINCHRRLLIARVLEGEDVRVLHLRGDGAIQNASAFEVASPAAKQLSLFDMGSAGDAAEAVEGMESWKSIRPVSPRRAPSNSSDLSNGPASDDF